MVVTVYWHVHVFIYCQPLKVFFCSEIGLVSYYDWCVCVCISIISVYVSVSVWVYESNIHVQIRE